MSLLSLALTTLTPVIGINIHISLEPQTRRLASFAIRAWGWCSSSSRGIQLHSMRQYVSVCTSKASAFILLYFSNCVAFGCFPCVSICTFPRTNTKASVFMFCEFARHSAEFRSFPCVSICMFVPVKRQYLYVCTSKASVSVLLCFFSSRGIRLHFAGVELVCIRDIKPLLYEALSH